METHRLALASGFRIAQFQIEGLLGKGGFGITYVAVDVNLGKRVAIKELLPDSIATRVDGSTVVPQTDGHVENWEWARERFVEEARVLAGFSHPSIVGIHQLLEANGTVYMVMDFVQGESLESKLRREGPITDQEALMAIIDPILLGLEVVHAKGLLHRDIKPDNILITPAGNPILIDFGAARSLVGSTVTMTSMVTHGYSPIEQYQTKGKVGPWTDIYAVGAVICRAITGEKPPVAPDRIEEDEFRWLSNLGLVGYSSKFLQCVDWALRTSTKERPTSLAEWRNLLDSDLFEAPIRRTEPPPLPKPEPEPEPEKVNIPDIKQDHLKADVPLDKPSKDWQALVTLMVVLVVVILSSIGVGIFGGLQPSSAKMQAEIGAAEAAKTAAESGKASDLFADLVPRAAGTAKATEEKVPDSITATKDSPFENSLGMKFVPVPGTDVLFSIWETRVRDYAAFVEATSHDAGTDWKDPGFQQTINDPVVNVSWLDAQEFCKWLTDKERMEGIIRTDQTYRLPTDEEWSAAVGLPPESSRTPRGKSGKIYSVYPWGSKWPSPKGVGNYSPLLRVDNFDHTSPVGSFPENQYGLYDMGGNAWEWCADWYDEDQKYRVVRGGSWNPNDHGFLLSSIRDYDYPDFRYKSFGFRCVLVGGSSR